ncbi:MAG: lectin [Betaproteobacteria bacterium 13_1_20CM_3_63_8]|nr:MAG: lectin [Betaproteobacteria bacterium 13_1_20CM_3_63_8]
MRFLAALLALGCSAVLAQNQNMSFFVTSAGPGNGADLGATGAVNARERIGKGPWQNAKGQVVAKSVDELHGANNLNKETALTEKGEKVNGRGDSPNMHDILTGSQPDGRAFPAGKDMTCGNWTKSGEGAAMLGHHDRQGLRDDDASKSWNSSHPSRGCSQDALKSTGGNGLFYCFATN